MTKVLKFGGSSLGDSGRIRKVSEIITNAGENIIVVVSAMQGVTSKLQETGQLAAQGNEGYLEELEELEKLHLKTIKELTGPKKQSSAIANIKMLFNELESLLKGVYVLKEITDKTNDYILSYGEQLSALILSKCLEAEYMDARKIIRTDRNFGKANINYEITSHLIEEKLNPGKKCIVVTGFICSSEYGETTTLGRGGSDLTASIIASTLESDVLEIWTDVDGIMTANPRQVEKAYNIEQLTYAEAMELSHFGAKVIYPPTVLPAYKKNIPVWIKNTFNPESKGSLITDKPSAKSKRRIKGISSIENIDLITVRGLGMVGVTGISQRLFGTLAKKEINIILISQASSEYSISIAIEDKDTDKARGAISEEFAFEMLRGQISNIDIDMGMAIVAIVGENMKHTPGISGKLFNTLGMNGINVAAIAQGASELNVSFVIKTTKLRKALNVLHESFFLSEYKQLNLFLCGIGTVGGKLIKQIASQQKKLLKEQKLKVNITGIANSHKLYIMEKGIVSDNHLNSFEKHGIDSNSKTYVKAIKDMNLRNSIFVDCTANESVAAWYKELLEANISIVTANKIACSSDYSYYKSLKETAKSKGAKFYYETNVGAGLPVIGTLNDLVNSGDKVIRLEAVLSGTLNYIFNTMSKDITFSKAIQMAKDSGFSEPDPRLDLSGADVVRKLVILARESGYKIGTKDVEIEDFLPKEAFKGSVDDFFKVAENLNDDFEKQRSILEKENKKWRYLATLDKGKAKVSLQTVGNDHPCYALEGSNNIVMITTERYHEEPMLIKGYGAGADVTAAGVFADIIRVGHI